MARLTEAPLDHYPNACIITGRDDGEIIDTGQTHEVNPMFDRIHLYFKRSQIEDLAREHCGMVSKAEVDDLKDRFDQLEQRFADQDRAIAAFNGFKENFPDDPD